MSGAEVLGTSAGISLTGGYIYNALAAGNADAVISEGGTLDVCLSHPSPSSEFHYHFWGPCLKKNYGYWNDKTAAPLCRLTDGCKEDPAAFSRSATENG